MTCHDARDRLSALLDDALGETERPGLEAHLAGCADCRRELGQLRATVALLTRLPSPRAPAGFVDRVMAAAARRSWPRRVLAVLFVPLRVKLPLEAAAAVVVGVSALYVYQQAPEIRERARQESRESAAPAPALPPPAPSPAPRASVPRSAGRTAEPPAGAPAPAREPGPKDEAREQATQPEASRPAARDSREAPAAQSRPAPPVASRDDTGPAARPVPPPPAAPKPPAVAAPPSEPRAGAGGTPSPAPAAPSAERAPGALSTSKVPLARRHVRAVDARGRLVVPAREPAEAALDTLLGRVGGRRVERRLEGDRGLVVIDVLVSGARYRELIAGLGEIGRWVTDQEPGALPPQLRVEVAMTVEP